LNVSNAWYLGRPVMLVKIVTTRMRRLVGMPVMTGTIVFPVKLDMPAMYVSPCMTGMT